MIAIGCDHGGFALKQEVMRHLDELGLAYKDFGTYSEEAATTPSTARPWPARSRPGSASAASSSAAPQQQHCP